MNFYAHFGVLNQYLKFGKYILGHCYSPLLTNLEIYQDPQFETPELQQTDQKKVYNAGICFLSV